MPHVISHAKNIKAIEKNKTLKTLPNLFINVKKNSLKESNKFKKNSKILKDYIQPRGFKNIFRVYDYFVLIVSNPKKQKV
jgi:hypothetical protein